MSRKKSTNVGKVANPENLDLPHDELQIGLFTNKIIL